eukprot:GILK01004177.1.p1 GENE.GILK01004177.1~~GILK01004177.1.p1  ORF type:complete len:154 (-),score=14.48 GILK01004177.1:42-470(-)
MATDASAKFVSTIVPELTVSDANGAIEFYTTHMGAVLLAKHCAENGKVAHSMLQFKDAVFYVCDDFAECHLGKAIAPAAGNTSSPVTISLKLSEDAEAQALFDKVVAGGATATLPYADAYWGGKYGKYADPFGHVWSVSWGH